LSHPQNSNFQIPPLRDYQREDVEFLKKHPRMACFNEQRTGKTPISIRALTERGLTKILVICPKSAIYPWADEFTRWSGLPAVALTGTPHKKYDIISEWKIGGLIAGYDSIKETKRSSGLLEHILNQKPQAAILDEAHRIKDRTTANAKMAFELSKHIEYLLALTGTPAPNKPHEIWSILHFLEPMNFRSFWNFVTEYCYTRRITGQRGQAYIDIGGLKTSRVADLQ
jgi:SNF2 family DNA or RNA helicase